MAWPRRNAPTVLLGAALLASAGLLLALGSGQTFFQDTWSFLLDRRGISTDAFLAPHNEHIVVIPVAIEKLLVAVFGMTSATPERVAMALVLITTGALMFVYVRRRVGPWVALMAATLLLFLGAAWPVLLWPFEIGFVGSVMAGIATLLALDRDDRRGDVGACILLTISIGFGSVGLSFLAAALVDVLQKRRSRGLRRVYLVVVPALLYLAWYVGWGHVAERHLTLHNVLMSPQYLLDGFASSIGSLAGLSNIPVNAPGQPEWGRPLLVGLVALAIYGQKRRPGFSPAFWRTSAVAVSYWLLAAFNFFPGREASSTRYVYAGAAFVLLMAADLLQGVRFSRRALWIGAGLTFVAICPNLAQMKDGANWLDEQAVLTKADTGALEIARRTVSPAFSLTPEVSGTGSLIAVQAGRYFEAVDAHGSPAYTPRELTAAPPVGRHWADVVLSRALPLSTVTHLGASLPNDPARCVTIPEGEAEVPEVQLEPGLTRVWLAPGPEAELTLRRFATAEYPVDLGSIPGGSMTLLRIPHDRSSQPWNLRMETGQKSRFCG
jgi:hypothetical protein